MKNFNELVVNIKAEEWKVFIAHMVNISSLCKDPMKVEFTSSNIRIYNVVKSGSTFMAFKDILIPKIFDVENDFTWVIFNPNEVKKLFTELVAENIKGVTKDLNLKFIIRNDNYLFKLIASDGKFDITILGGDNKAVPIIPMKAIDAQLENDCLYETILGEDILKRIQNLSKTKSENENDKLSDVISIEFLNDDVLFGDSRWSIKLGKTSEPNQTFYFKKNYLLKTHNKSINIKVYDKFLLITDEPYRVLVVLEINSN